MTKPIFLVAIVLVAVSAVAPAAFQNIRGSLVVAIVSPKADYVVVAAESRNTNGWTHTPDNDHACKIISLGGKTLFFEAGQSMYSSHRGDLWDSRAVAREVYLKSKKHDAHALSLAWVDEAERWFAKLPDTEMGSVANAYSGESAKIGTGGFVAFDAHGIPMVDAQNLYYSFLAKTFSEGPEFAPPGPGQGGASGVALDLVDEFFKIKSPRAALARGSDFVGVDAAGDSRIAANAIQFAETYSTEPEKSRIGGPIDIAVLRKNATVEWPNRKDECYQYDLKAGPTKATGSGQTP